MLKSRPKYVKILVWIALVLLLALLGFFTAGYFYYGNILRKLLVSAIHKESKGLYNANVDRIYINLMSGNVHISGLTIVPDTALFDSLAEKELLNPLLAEIRLEKLKIRDLSISGLVQKRELKIRKILISNPEVILYHMHSDSARPSLPDSGAHPLTLPLPNALRLIRVEEIRVSEGRFSFVNLEKDTAQIFSLPSAEITVMDLFIDGLPSDTTPVFNAGDIRLRFNEVKTGAGLLYDISVGEIFLSTRDRMILAGEFRLIPKFTKEEFSDRAGHQTDRMEIAVDSILVKDFDVKGWILSKSIIAGSVRIAGLTLEDFRDKRETRLSGKKPDMPHQLIKKLNNRMKIDTLVVSRGKVTYMEQVADEPGTIFFDGIEAMLTGLTNDTMLLGSGHITKLNGRARLQGKGVIVASFDFYLGDRSGKFHYSAELGPFDLTLVNPMVTRLLPARIVSGKADRLMIAGVSANDHIARGALLFYYHNLHIELAGQDQTRWSRIKTGVINFAANKLILNARNPLPSGKMKTGVIYFQSDQYKGIVNFIWKSTLSGIKSSMGFNTEEQKAIKKDKK